MKKIIYGIIVIVTIVACEEMYDPPPQSLMQVVLESTDSTDTSIPVVTAYGIDKDSIWIDKVATKTFRLPLSTQHSTTFVLLLDSVADTLTIFHKNELIFESAETGFYYEHTISDIEHTMNRIDDFDVLDTAVTKNWHENILLNITPLPADGN